MSHKIGIFKLIVLLISIIGLNQSTQAQEKDSTQQQESEQISTWKFANNVGWRGVELNFGGQTPMKGQEFNPNYFRKIGVASQQAGIRENLYLNSYNGPFATTSITINIKGIFLPFRNSSKRILKKTEWHTGLAYHHEAYFYYIEFEQNAYRLYQIKENSLFLTNSLQFESKSFFNRAKLFAGPGLNLAIIPERKVSRETYPNEVPFSLSVGKYAFQSYFNAGLKISLGCRFNIQASYILSQNNWILKNGFESRTNHGIQFGLRYKFMKPAKREIDMDAPFW